MAFAFVPMAIGALTGVRDADAGVASGLLTTNQQIGGAVGVAVAMTIATTFTKHYADAHGTGSALTDAALVHGFAITYYVLAAIAAVGAVTAALMLEPSSPALLADHSTRVDEAASRSR
jgi:hypothetical protein